MNHFRKAITTTILQFPLRGAISSYVPEHGAFDPAVLVSPAGFLAFSLVQAAIPAYIVQYVDIEC